MSKKPSKKASTANLHAPDRRISASAVVEVDHLAAACLAAYTLGFIFFRIAEIGMCVYYYTRECVSVLVGTIMLHLTLGLRGKMALHILSMVVLVHFLDNYLPKPLPPPPNNNKINLFSSRTIVITGANAGIGYEASRQLAVNYGMQVIMGCRSESRCNKASNDIRAELAATNNTQGSVTPMLLDLSNFDSVETFASQLKGRHIGTLFNNAGYVPTAGLPVNSYGLDPSFTSMHISHFYLTELLLRENPTMRVINTSSGTHHLCALPFAYIPQWIRENYLTLPQSCGCITEEFLQSGIRSETDDAAYIQAKLANVMHAVEIPRRHPNAALSVAIDLGWVGTMIQPFMRDTVFTPTNVGWMRNVHIGVLPVMHAVLSSNEELLNDLEHGRASTGIVMNVFGRTMEAFTLPWWTTRVNLGRDRMMELGEKLWEESAKVIQSLGHDVW